MGIDDNSRTYSYYSINEYRLLKDDVIVGRMSSNKGLVLGNVRFKYEIEVLTLKRFITGKRGRPVG